MRTGSETLIALDHVSKTYSGITVLRDASIEIRAGEVLALVGENGAGKSTLIKILSGAEHPDPGAQLTYFGQTHDAVDPVRTLHWGVSVIYQDLSLFPNLTVAENLGFTRAREGHGVYRPSAWRSAAVEVLERLGLDFDVDAPVETLSFGQQQMLAIARAVATEARVIVMDEPTSALSAVETEILYRIVDELRAAQVGIVFISHKLDEVFRICDRVMVLRDGQVVTTGGIPDFTQDDLIAAMVGRRTEYAASRVEGEAGEEILGVDDLLVGGTTQGVSFSVRRNEIVAITGLVGSGRTELAHTIFGMTPARSGRLRVDGKEVVIGSPADALAHGIGYLPEDRRLQGIFAGHSIRTNATVAALDRLVDRFRRIVPRKEDALVARYTRDLDIRPALPSADASTLSGGNQQKVLLARWMAAEPRLLIVDEPTSGVDIGAKREIHRLLQGLAASGTGVLVISSELSEVLALANRILVMRGGRIVGETTPGESTQESILTLELQGDHQ
ncbi:sugar ABC transporter ATP-binding protein [Brooklawnia cerclae]|uniref:ABC-type sugar transport system ATPase subunit n=1 Tax=Brooklawnia cerclae TaxID=349934 RepID=A0ABX0SHT8_9ACTN|nr:sugar ABC transporter ATP-binding protein [Brooklawnia cerclae]NIH57958.1 ABC-type sugar transport system ATPase subunit [Brooklawnia cerclae]